MTIEETAGYGTARQLYWDVQTAFRQVAVGEIRRLMIHSGRINFATFDVEDNGSGLRLTLDDLFDAEGLDLLDSGWEEYDDYRDSLDQIAMDMEFASWDEAASTLPRNDDRTRFIMRVDR